MDSDIDQQSPLIYLAAPFTGRSQKVMQRRHDQTEEFHRHLTHRGLVVYNPLNALKHIPMPSDHRYNHGLAVLRHSDLVILLALDGYKESHGVKLEVDLAMKLGIEVFVVGPDQDLNPAFVNEIKRVANQRLEQKNGAWFHYQRKQSSPIYDYDPPDPPMEAD